MNFLTNVISRLTSSEVRMIENFLRHQVNAQDGKRLKLFKLIREGKIQNNKEAARKIYRSEPNAAYFKLKNRLQKDVLRLLLMSEEKPDETSIEHVHISYWKQHLLQKILQSKGLRMEKYAESETLLSSNQQLASFEGLFMEQSNKKAAPCDGFNTMDHQLLAFHLLSNSRDLSRKIFAHLSLNPIATPPEPELAHNILMQMESFPGRKNSASLQASYLYLNGLLLLTQKKSALALLEISAAHKIMRNNPLYFETELMNEVHCSRGLSNFTSGNTEKATRIANTIAQQNNPDTLFFACELLFQISFRNKDFDAAQRHLERMLKTCPIEPGNFNCSKWSYYSACLLFQKADYKAARSMLYHNDSLYKFKSTIANEQRLLELHLLIALNEQELFEYKFSAFKQFLRRHKTEDVHLKTACNCFQKLIKNSFDFGAFDAITKPRQKTANSNLNTKEFNYQIICFDEWRYAHINKPVESHN